MDNSTSFEPWGYRSTVFSDPWMSDAFLRDTDTLTKALQQSLCNNNNQLSPDHLTFVKPEPSPTASGSDPDSSLKRITTGRVSKRKSRASKRTPTTFITADPANFRQMVQQVTGIRFGNSHVPVGVPILKPEPQRFQNNYDYNSSCCLLPTLDTSAFLLNNNNNNNGIAVGPTVGAAAAAATNSNNCFSFSHVEEEGGFDFDTTVFQSFPTLESWRVM
ncbi:hypothetical protein GIB67_010458 [Kingdonia uniflora]|uniref:VQ domain-containing protein n=1 Tax=Kingdonia uniflora TaxID=39325 RepID=A0A7J7MAR8_9MAGN|nr:hypothetical protein GIB67_010458 [Kingdonia uniflora]